MEKLIIEGGKRLAGEIALSGAKNAALPILAATILAEGPCSLGDVPELNDVTALSRILQSLGLRVERGADGRITTEVLDEKLSIAGYDLVSRMRASICVLGPLLAKRGEARVSLPGGCVIGTRPIDLHLKALRALGAEISIEHGYIVARAKRLKGTQIYLGGAFGSSVLGTGTAIMAAVLAEGRTYIEHAAMEPEVEDLARFLVHMGASIEGIGTHRLEIRGVRRLEGARHDVIPDRIEAGTLMAATAITGGEVRVRNAVPGHLAAVIDRLREAGVELEISAAGRDGGGGGGGNGGRADITVAAPKRARAVDITTLPYPGFPTDLQAQFMALLSMAEGACVITEKVFPDRFMHTGELVRMGADIVREGATAKVTGVGRLSGAPVMASDLRASAALVVAGLAAEGRTDVRRIYHLDRGYEKLEQKLSSLGAKIRRARDEED